MAFKKMPDHLTKDVGEIDLQEPAFDHHVMDPSCVDIGVNADMQVAKFWTEATLEMVKALAVVNPIQFIPHKAERFSRKPMVVLQGLFAVHKRNHAQVGFLNAFIL